MKKILALAVACAALSLAHTQAQVLIAGWDFQTTTTGGTAAAAAPGAPLSYAANFGTGTLSLNGTNGSSTFTSLASNPQVTSFGGSNLNTSGYGFSTDTSGTSSLAIANSSANGFGMVYAFSMAGMEDLSLSYATRGTSTGFSTHVWSYSTDGVTFTDFSTITGRTNTSFSVQTVNFSSVAALDGDSSVYIKVTISGATNASGNNRFDNVAFTATSVPEPTSVALIIGGAMFAIVRRKRAVLG